MRGANISNLAAMEQTQMLARTLAQNNDPKFQVHMCIRNRCFTSNIRTVACPQLSVFMFVERNKFYALMLMHIS